MKSPALCKATTALSHNKGYIYIDRSNRNLVSVWRSGTVWRGLVKVCSPKKCLAGILSQNIRRKANGRRKFSKRLQPMQRTRRDGSLLAVSQEPERHLVAIFNRMIRAGSKGRICGMAQHRPSSQSGYEHIGVSATYDNLKTLHFCILTICSKSRTAEPFPQVM